MTSINTTRKPTTKVRDDAASQAKPKPVKRKVSGFRAEDWFDLLGAAVAAISLTYLLFGWITPMYGELGFVLVSFFLFLVCYAGLISLHASREDVIDRLITVVLGSAGIILVGALLFVATFTILRGQTALPNWNFFSQTMQFAGPLDPITVGGIQHAIVGTLIQISIALAVTIPLGITTAVFLNEIGGGFARFVRTISDAMTALPSVVAGLFVLSAFIRTGIVPRSGFAAALAITVMMLPIVIRASDVVLRLVPGHLREASYALGASRFKTVMNVVLPTARSGLVTAVILGTARGIGETSPVLLTSGVSAVMNWNPFEGPMISLPLQAFDFQRSPEPVYVARGFGTAATLLILVLVLFTIARFIGGKGPGQLSNRQQARVSARSKQDEVRISLNQAKTSAAVSPAKPKRERS